MSLKRYFFIIPIASFVFGVGVLIYVYSLFQPVGSSEAGTTRFVIPKGQAASMIASRLQDEGLIKSSLVFRFVVKQQGFQDRLQAGSFQLSPAMSLIAIANQLTLGTNDIWVTLPEGWRREEIAASFSSNDFPAFDSKEFLNFTLSQEGRLFPDTYLFARESTAETIYKVLSNNFQKKVVTGLAEKINNSPYDFQEALIMASVVEREARGYEEMRHVAGILWRRIEMGMALQADATLQYIKGYNPQLQSWWEPPSTLDKKIISPFNTYLNSGLPPRPIANPGLEAIKATLDPLKTNDLFYLHDRSGGIHYAETLEKHNANVQQYLR
ncbi:endolytic transglycosylase MltG [Patescibacteria group bacterium]|nr:endolytic transglycosylase MltG [Patescibacteria group bacterium]